MLLHPTRTGAILAPIVSLALVALFATTGSAQVWNETGDAGQDIGTAQATVGTGSLTQINGTLESSYDVDMYCVQVGPSADVPGLPVFALQCVVNQGPNIFVFDANGYGIAMNETCQGGVKILTTNIIPTAGPVTLYLAVAYYGMEPLTGASTIWQVGLPGERAPDGSDPSAPLVGWLGTPNVQPINPYSINVGSGGVVTSFCDAPVPVEMQRWGTLKVRFR